MIQFQENHLSWALSLLLHAAIMAILAFSMIAPISVQHWYELDFREPLSLFEESIDTQAGGTAQADPSPENMSGQAAQASSSPSEQGSQVLEAPRSRETSPASSDLIETPVLADDPKQPGTINMGVNPIAQNALRQVVGGDGSNGGAVNFNITGGRVRFRLPAGYKHSLGAPGSVTMQFKVDQYARPITNTIQPIQQTEPRYFEAAKKVLLDGSFSFDGAPDPGVSCRITIEFL